jgi:tetratricopeptide (TPR) repeat protein/glycosyltransferase involved in cell wall biosynthesis
MIRLIRPFLEILQKSQLSRLISEGDAANARRNWSAAEAFYSKALSISPTLDAIQIQLGHALKEQGHLERAEQVYRSAIATRPNVSDSHLQLGHVLKLQNKMDMALKAYLDAYRLDPRSADALRELTAVGIRVAHTSNDVVKAPTVRQTAAQVRGDKARYRRDWTAAAEAYRSHLSETPEDLATRVQLGHVLKKAGRFDEALEAYRCAYAINPLDPIVLLSLGHLMKHCGDFLQAATLYAASAYIDNNRQAIKELRSPPILQYREQAAQQIIEGRELFGPVHRLIGEEITMIETFLEKFEWNKLMASGPYGRIDRIFLFLISAADRLDDLPLFNNSTYLDMYPHVARETINPLVHFLRHCEPHELNLHPLLLTRWYLERYPEVAASGVLASVHYARWGAENGYNPHPLFDTNFYKRKYTDINSSKINPLAHYLKFPTRDPHPLFDPSFYLESNPGIAATGMNPLVHYLTIGTREGRDPHRLFSSKFYLDTNRDVARSGVNPLMHYLEHGAREGREPHPEFSGRAYLAAYPDVAQSGINPLIHYLTEGIAEDRPFPSANSKTIAHFSSPPIVLMIDAWYPRPDRDSGSLDQISFVRIFQTLGYEVHFIADTELNVTNNYHDNLVRMGVRCVTHPQYATVDSFLMKNATRIEVCFLSRVHFGARHIDAIRRLLPQAKIVFNTVDLHHIREHREAELTQNPDDFSRAFETRELELSRTAKADATIVVSDQEARILQAEVPGARIFMVPLIRDYPVKRETFFTSRSGIGFIGGFLHKPNVDAVNHFLDDIWPLLRQRLPNAEFFVIGADLPKPLSERRDPGVTFIGYVPELAPWLDRLKMTVAPLRYGAGAKGKVVSSLAHGVPCVVSPIAAEGMGLIDGQEILIGRTPQEFVELMILLESDETRWLEVSDAGMNLIRKRYSLDHGVKLMSEILTAVGAPKPH